MFEMLKLISSIFPSFHHHIFSAYPYPHIGVWVLMDMGAGFAASVTSIMSCTITFLVTTHPKPETATIILVYLVYFI